MELSTMSSNLPPLRNLPSWSRVRDLDRARYPRLLSTDCMVRSPPMNLRTPKPAAQPCVHADGRRIASLEKDILFLQEQHKDTLERLHAEIEELKRSNRELQYQLVMKHQHFSKDSMRPSSNFSKRSTDCSTEQNCQCRFISSEEVCKEATRPGGGTVASLLPLRISCGPSQGPRTPTLTECEVIIRQLYHANNSQYQELLRVRKVLRDIVLSRKKSHTEAVSLAKACLHDNTRGDVFRCFSKLPPLKALPTEQPPSQNNQEETVEKLLPAIKRNFSSTMSERQRKAQDVHKMRLRRTVN